MDPRILKLSGRKRFSLVSAPLFYLAACPEKDGKWWAGLGSNQRRRKPEDLQSSPFNRSGTYPFPSFQKGRDYGLRATFGK